MRQHRYTRRFVATVGLVLGLVAGLGGPQAPRAEAEGKRHPGPAHVSRHVIEHPVHPRPALHAARPWHHPRVDPRPAHRLVAPAHPGPRAVSPGPRAEPGFRQFDRIGRPAAHPNEHRLIRDLVDPRLGFGRWHTVRGGVREDLELRANGRFVRERLDVRTGRKTVIDGSWALRDRAPGTYTLALTGPGGRAVEEEDIKVGGAGFVTRSGAARVEWFRAK